MVDAYVSAKVRWLSFLAVIMVVVIHSPVHRGEWLTHVLTQWAVPFLLVVSGAFFRLSMERDAVGGLVRKKIFSLLIPYVIWVSMGWMAFGGSDAFVVFGITNAVPHGYGVFWFVRQLMVSMIVLGIAFKLLQRLKANDVLKVGAASLFYVIFFLLFIRCPWAVAMPASPFYFLSGFLLPSFGGRVNSIVLRDGKRMAIVIVCLVVACSVRVLAIGCAAWLQTFVRNMGNFLMMITLWEAYDLVAKNRVMDTPLFMRCAFGIYCVHIYMLSFAGRVLSDPWGICLLGIGLSIGCVYLMERFLPVVSRIVFGGR